MRYFKALFFFSLAAISVALLTLNHWVSYLYFVFSLPLLIPIIKLISVKDQIKSGNIVGLANTMGLKTELTGRIILLIDFIILPLTWIKALIAIGISQLSIPKGTAGPPQMIGIYVPPTIVIASSYFILSGTIAISDFFFGQRPSVILLAYLGFCCILSSFTLNVLSSSYKRTLLNPKINAIVSTILMSASVVVAFYMLQEKRDQTQLPSVEGITFVWSFMTMQAEMVYFQSLVADAFAGALTIGKVLSSSSLWALFFIIAAVSLDAFVLKQAYKSVTVKLSDADKSALVFQCLHLMSLKSAQKIIDGGFDNKDYFIRYKIQMLFLSGDVIGLQAFLSQQGFKKGRLSEKDRAVVMRALLETPDLNQFSDMSRFFDTILTLGFKRSEIVLFMIFAAMMRLHSGAIPIKSKVTRAHTKDIPFFDILARSWTEDVSAEFLEVVDSEELSDIDETLKVGTASLLISIDGVSDKLSVENAISLFEFMSERRGAVADQLHKHKPSGLIEYYAAIANNLQHFLKMKHGIDDDGLRDALQSAMEHASSEGRSVLNLEIMNRFLEKNLAS